MAPRKPPADTTRRLEYVPLSAVKAATRNPKRHDEAQIRASMDRFGFVDPLAHDGRTGRLIAGHGRIDELRRRAAAGEPVPDGIQVDPESGEWLVPVTVGWASKNAREADALAIALNRLTERGGWDVESLADLLGDLLDSAGLDGTGFEEADLNMLLAELAGGPTSPADEWEGMPDFDQPSALPAYSTVVHFLNHDDAAKFWTELLHEEHGPRRTAWWPHHDTFEGGADSTHAVVQDT